MPLASILIAAGLAQLSAAPATAGVPAASGAPGVPVLVARARTLDILDGTHLFAGIYTADPAIPLDVYHARRSGAARTITLRSDLGELALAVEPGKEHPFVVRLASGEDCPARISTLRQPYRRSGPIPPGGVDVIPFRLEDGWMMVTASVNGSAPLDLMLDTGADNLVLFPSALEKGCALRLDGSMANAGLGGTTTRATSSGNRLELEGLVFEHELVLHIEQQIGACDGILGYVAFEDKVLEIDPDALVLRLHDAVPAEAAAFARLPLRHHGTILALETDFDTGRARGREWLIVDTGSTASLHLDQALAARHALLETLEVVGSSQSRGVGPGVLRNEIVRIPALRFGAHVLTDVPAHVEAPGQERGVSSGNLLGMQVLGRFHAFLDLERMEAYLAPGARFGDPFPVRTGPPPGLVLLGAGVIAAAAVVTVRRARRRRLAGRE